VILGIEFTIYVAPFILKMVLGVLIGAYLHHANLPLLYLYLKGDELN